MNEQTPIADHSLLSLQRIVRQHLDDETAQVNVLSAELMQHSGSGGNDLYRAMISWKAADGSGSARWVLKHWRPGGLTGYMMDVTSPAEALAWDSGLLQCDSLPRGMTVPFVGAKVDEDGAGAWIVMEDISAALNTSRSVDSAKEMLAQARFALDRLACFHAYWEHPDRLATLEKCAWLLPQKRCLWCVAPLYAHCLGRNSLPDKKWLDHPITKQAIQGTLAFVDWLPKKDCSLWKDHMCDRAPLVEAFSDLPQTLLHGDLSGTNIGLRWSSHNRELLLIDWEWIGLGSPALDVVKFLNSLHFANPELDSAPELANDYFEYYVTHGGTQMNRETWNRAYELGVIYHGLWPHPFFAGLTLGGDPASVDRVRQRTQEITQAMRAWLA